MKTTEFIQKYSPGNEVAEFARQFETMAEVWQSCQKSDWLFWILEKHAPLEKSQSVRLAIAFAEAALANWENKADQRPALAIQAAEIWLSNPTEENQAAARSAADAAWAAAWSAEAAAARSARSAWEAAWAAAWSAEAAARAAARAAWSAAWSAWSAEAAEEAACDTIRQFIPNPF